MTKNYPDITVILTLYKTPENKLKNLNQYKKYKTIFFDQESNGNLKNKIRYFFKGNFKYYSSPRNIGLSKSSNFLLSKVKTRYCLFTQPDIKIYDTSILMLKKSMKLKTNVIFSAPKFVKKIKNSNNNKRLSLKIVNKVNAACMMCDVEKLKKIGFFDEDFFLYWEDIFLMNKINQTNYKMLLTNNALASHDSSNSSINTMKINFIRNKNFMYGELVYDYKLNKLRKLKIIRKLFQNIMFFFFNSLLFKLKHALINFANIMGIFKFLKFCIKIKH